MQQLLGKYILMEYVIENVMSNLVNNNIGKGAFKCPVCNHKLTIDESSLSDSEEFNCEFCSSKLQYSSIGFSSSSVLVIPLIGLLLSPIDFFIGYPVVSVSAMIIASLFYINSSNKIKVLNRNKTEL